MKIEIDYKIMLLKETIAEMEKRIQLIKINDDNDYINKEHLETLAKNVRLMVVDLIREIK